MVGYVAGLGRAPRVKVLAKSPCGTWLWVQELSGGNPLDGERGPAVHPYWVEEKCVYNSYRALGRFGARYELSGAVASNQLPVKQL